MNYFYAALAAGIILFTSLLYGLAYKQGYRSAQSEYESKLQASNIETITQIKNMILSQKEREHSLVSEYLIQIETLKEEHENEIKTLTADKLSNTVKCVSDSNKANTGVPSKTPIRSDLICYSEAELLKKIKRSLDIAEECDKLAYRYNTLLSVCKGESPSGKGNGF